MLSFLSRSSQWGIRTRRRVGEMSNARVNATLCLLVPIFFSATRGKGERAEYVRGKGCETRGRVLDGGETEGSGC